jgi:hypothetical protein
MNRHPHPSFALAAALAVLGPASPGLAQEDDLAVVPPPAETTTTASSGGLEFTVRGGAGYQFKTNIDSAGEIEIAQYGISIEARTRIARDVTLMVGGSYQFDKFDFSENTFGGIDPWDDIHTIGFRAMLNIELASDWSAFIGPVFQIARESGGDWDDAWIAGGVAGASFQVNRDLVLGVGIGVTSQLQDSARIIPIPMVRWDITDDMRLTSTSEHSVTSLPGLELEYDLADDWEVAGGIGYRLRRFRLDSDGPIPDGVGEESAVPLWLRLTFHPSPNIRLSFKGGAVLGGKLEAEASDGDKFDSPNYDPAGFVAFVASIRF